MFKKIIRIKGEPLLQLQSNPNIMTLLSNQNNSVNHSAYQLSNTFHNPATIQSTNTANNSSSVASSSSGSGASSASSSNSNNNHHSNNNNNTSSNSLNQHNNDNNAKQRNTNHNVNLKPVQSNNSGGNGQKRHLNSKFLSNCFYLTAIKIHSVRLEIAWKYSGT